VSRHQLGLQIATIDATGAIRPAEFKQRQRGRRAAVVTRTVPAARRRSTGEAAPGHRDIRTSRVELTD
jgi:hypothetical protein